MAKGDTSIKVSEQTRERLTLLAAEQHMTVRELVGNLAAMMPTDEEIAERVRRTRAALAEHFGVEVGPAELAAGARLREEIARRAIAAA
ncbi:MAG: hypothetical protein FWD74_04895 [Actinomycetia bacterium]|nr:hypothetical protein [Actinomycetes bacterium]